MPRRRTRTKPFDGPGTDVGERMHAVQVNLVITGLVPPRQMRHRGDQLYPREWVPAYWSQQMAFSEQAFEEGSEEELALGIARRFLRAARQEGWPPKPGRRRREDRPGA